MFFPQRVVFPIVRDKKSGSVDRIIESDSPKSLSTDRRRSAATRGGLRAGPSGSQSIIDVFATRSISFKRSFAAVRSLLEKSRR